MSNDIYLIGTAHQDIDGPERLSYILGKTNPNLILVELSENLDHVFHTICKPIPPLEEIIVQKKKECDDLEKSFLNPNQELKEIQKEVYKMFGQELSPKQIATLGKGGELIASIQGYELIIPKAYVAKNPSASIGYIDIPVENVEELAESYRTTMESEVSSLFQLNEKNKDDFLKVLSQGLDAYIANQRKNTQAFYDNLEDVKQFFKQRKDDNASEENPIIKYVYNPKRDEYMASKIREFYLGNPSQTLLVIAGIGHLLFLEDSLKDLKPEKLTLSDYKNL